MLKVWVMKYAQRVRYGQQQVIRLTTAYQVIDPTPDPVTGLAPVYTPGTLRGTIDVDVMDAQQTIPYQVNQSTPDADGLIPISFSTGSSATLQNDLAFDRPFRSPFAYVKVPYFTADIALIRRHVRDIANTDYRVGNDSSVNRTHVQISGRFDPQLAGSSYSSHIHFALISMMELTLMKQMSGN